METIEVTTSRGDLFKRTFKNSTITSANTLLKGNKLVIQQEIGLEYQIRLLIIRIIIL